MSYPLFKHTSHFKYPPINTQKFHPILFVFSEEFYDDHDDHDELFLQNGSPTKGIKPYHRFSSLQISDMLQTGFEHAETEFRLC